MLKSVQHLDGYRIGGIDSGFLKVISRFAITYIPLLNSFVFER